jgi:DNA-binding response OmpR family regulator
MPRLLLIEDDFDTAEMLATYFDSHGYEVVHADNGPDGIALARSTFPNLILLDVMLPHMDGYDVCLALRSATLTRYIPILFLTQRDERASKVRGLELGADDYITKPFDVDELRLRVQASIRRATQEYLHESRTGLPTGPLVDEARAAAARGQVELRLHVQHYAAFGDVYGFVAAGQAMSHAAGLIQAVISAHGTENDFVGIDGDTFVVLTAARQPDALGAQIAAQFNDDVRAFYSYVDVERGGVLAADEGDNGGERLIPLMALAVERVDRA